MLFCFNGIKSPFGHAFNKCTTLVCFAYFGFIISGENGCTTFYFAYLAGWIFLFLFSFIISCQSHFVIINFAAFVLTEYLVITGCYKFSPALFAYAIWTHVYNNFFTVLAFNTFHTLRRFITHVTRW